MNKFALILAVVAGIAGVVVSFLYLSKQTPEKPRQEALVEILVLADDLPGNHVLNPGSDLKTERIPAETFAQLARTAVKPEEIAAVTGRRTGGPLTAGTPLLYSHLVGLVDFSFSSDKRAMTIAVGPEESVGGMLIPGDRVDIVIARPLPPEPAPVEAMPDDPQMAQQAAMSAMLRRMMRQEQQVEYRAEIVLSDVKILAVGQRLKWTREQLFTMSPSGFTPGGAPPSVTIEVTLDEALKLVETQASGGNLTLLLRSTREPGAVFES